MWNSKQTFVIQLIFVIRLVNLLRKEQRWGRIFSETGRNEWKRRL